MEAWKTKIPRKTQGSGSMPCDIAEKNTDSMRNWSISYSFGVGKVWSKVKVQDKEGTENKPALTVRLVPLKGKLLCGTGMTGKVPTVQNSTCKGSSLETCQCI